MAIRLRTVNGERVALCAAETDPMPGDAYLDDRDHEALAAKFWRDYQGLVIDWCDPVKDAAAATQKLRNARDVQEKWLAEQDWHQGNRDNPYDSRRRLSSARCGS